MPTTKSGSAQLGAPLKMVFFWLLWHFCCKRNIFNTGLFFWLDYCPTCVPPTGFLFSSQLSLRHLLCEYSFFVLFGRKIRALAKNLNPQETRRLPLYWGAAHGVLSLGRSGTVKSVTRHTYPRSVGGWLFRVTTTVSVFCVQVTQHLRDHWFPTNHNTLLVYIVVHIRIPKRDWRTGYQFCCFGPPKGYGVL